LTKKSCWCELQRILLSSVYEGLEVSTPFHALFSPYFGLSFITSFLPSLKCLRL
jgi:hypothetical protein